jgi:hypothetical protein
VALEFNGKAKRAGLKTWPRLFHNLRASRETELVERFPVQVVTSWLGNTPAVATRHYLMTAEAHFAAALGDEKAAQKTARRVHAECRGDSRGAQAAHEKTPDSVESEVFQHFEVAGTGFEPATSRL